MSSITTPAPVSTTATTSVETSEKTPAPAKNAYEMFLTFLEREEGQVYKAKLNAMEAAEEECYAVLDYLRRRWDLPSMTRTELKAQKIADIPLIAKSVAYFEKLGLEFQGFPEPTNRQFYENAQVMYTQMDKLIAEHKELLKEAQAAAIAYETCLDSVGAA
jgi:hypothetical protein